jgi:hypothetical protein
METAREISTRKVKKMIEAVNYDEEIAVRDILADLRHYCDTKELDFANEDRIAYDNYSEEAADTRATQKPRRREEQLPLIGL